MSYPKRFKEFLICKVLFDPDRRRNLLCNMNPRFFNSIEGNLDGLHPSWLIWEGDPSGIVTTSNFCKSFTLQRPPIWKFENIWQPWIPLRWPL